MANIFTLRRGYVVRLTEDAVGEPLSVLVESFDEDLNAILTGVTVGSQANVQFMQTLANLIYVYVLGEKLGELTLSGLCVRGRCDGDGALPSLGHGIERIQNFYNEHGVARRREPLRIEIGSTAYQGLLTGFQAGLTDAEGLVGQFSLQCRYLTQQK